jgi:pilus assembly protein CpaC
MGRLAIRILAIHAVVCAALLGSAARAGEPTMPIGDFEAGLKVLSLGIGKSAVIDLPRDAKDVLVANPAVANAVVRSTRRVYLIGVAVGQTNVFFFDAEGRQIAGFDIAVKRDLNGIRDALRKAIPHGDIRVDAIGPDGVVLTGSVSSAAESQQAFDIAARLLNFPTANMVAEGSKLVNAITIRGKDQVMLKVTVSEVQRDIVKQLGVDLNASLGYGNAVLRFNNDGRGVIGREGGNPFTVSNSLPPNALLGAWSSGNNTVGATLRALERAGVMRTLAEPNLSAISGEAASFLAGGEFPIPTGLTCSTASGCQTSVEFKKFGVGLNFTPVVLSEGRISLKVATEVSELSSEGALPLTAGIAGASSTLTIPALRVRRADTTVEIPSGGTLAMAGMIQEQTRQAINGLPGLMQVPILGALFKSRDYQNRQTELVVFVTPYIVKSVAQKDLSKPDDGFADASDPQTVLLGKLNKVYGMPGRAEPDRRYYGRPGFILD